MGRYNGPHEHECGDCRTSFTCKREDCDTPFYTGHFCKPCHDLWWERNEPIFRSLAQAQQEREA